jgi:hypothetical protein
MTGAEIIFTVESNCPHCNSRNRYHQLSAVHTNMKTNLNKSIKEIKLGAKCERCDKFYEITQVRFA